MHLVRTYGDYDPTHKHSLHHGGLPAFKLHKVIHLLESQLDADFNLQPLAQKADLSEFHFSRAFKQAIGFSPSRYSIRMRMAKARRLLRETSKTVIEIGLDVGYFSPGHFVQVFRRESGVSPSDYRLGD